MINFKLRLQNKTTLSSYLSSILDVATIRA